MPDVITFTVPLPPAVLSPNSRAHWRTKYREGQAYKQAVWIACREQAPGYQDMNGGYAWSDARLVLTQRARRLRDQDNFLASMKYGIDALHCQGAGPQLGLVWDDSPDCLSIELRAEKVATRAEEGVLVQIERRQG